MVLTISFDPGESESSSSFPTVWQMLQSLQLGFLYVQFPFKPLLVFWGCFVLFLCPRSGESVLGPSVISFPIVGWSGGGVVFLPLPCLHLSCPSLCGSSMLHRNCPVSPQFFFRRHCRICRQRFSVSMGRDELRMFLYCHLGPNFWNTVFLISLAPSGYSRTC